MKAGKPEAKVRDCPCCSGGRCAQALRTARKVGADLKEFESDRRCLHALVERRNRLPGAGALLVEEAARLRQSIGESEGILVESNLRPQLMRERRALIDNQGRRLEELEAVLADLPEEVRVEPLTLVRRAEDALNAARASGADPQKVAEKARALGPLREKAAAVIAERREVQKEIGVMVLATFGALAAALTAVFHEIEGKVRELTKDPALLEVPELLDQAALRASWKRASELSEAAGMLDCVLNPADLEKAVPAVLLPVVREAVRFRPMNVA